MVELGWGVLGLTCGVCLVYQSAFAAVAILNKFDKVTDFAGGTNFAVVALLTFFLGGHTGSTRTIVATAAVCVWSARLAVFLLCRILLWGEDKRFDEMRSKPAVFAGFWAIQFLWVWVVTLAIALLNEGVGGDPGRAVGGVDFAGWALLGLGLVLETVADFQKLFFKQNADNAGRWCAVGLWKWSRHPNYFGEMLFWLGVYLACVEGLGWRAAVVGFLSPAFIFALLMFLSGMPLLEASAHKKHGAKPEYRHYLEGTSILVPLPNALYRALPRAVKTYVLLDLDLYRKGLADGADGGSYEAPAL